MKKGKKLLALLLALTLVTVLFAACGGNDKESNETGSENSSEEGTSNANGGEIIIGGSGPLTGDAASYGISVKQGAQAAVEEINAAGGVLGKDLKLVFLDDEATEEGAISAYSQLKDQKVDFVLGTVTTGSCLAITSLTNEDGILQLTPSASAKDCTKYDNVFRVCFTDPLQGVKMAGFAKDSGYEKVAVLFKIGDEYSTGMKDAFVEEAENLGIEVVSTESFQESAMDFSAQLTSIKNAGPDVIFIPAYYQDVAKILDQANKQDIDVPFIGCDGWDGILGIDSVPENIEGCIFLSPFVADDDAENVKNFVSKYKDDYGSTPDQFAADGYDGVYIIKAAIEKANSTTNADVIKAMTEIEVDGVTGKMTFDASGEPDKDAKFIIIKDGKYQSYTQ